MVTSSKGPGKRLAADGQRSRSSTRVQALVEQFETQSSRTHDPSSSTFHQQRDRETNLNSIQNDRYPSNHIPPKQQSRSMSMPTAHVKESPGVTGQTIRAAVGGMNWEPIKSASDPSKSRIKANKPVTRLQSTLTDHRATSVKGQSAGPSSPRASIPVMAPSTSRNLKSLERLETSSLKKPLYDGLPVYRDTNVLPIFPDDSSHSTFSGEKDYVNDSPSDKMPLIPTKEAPSSSTSPRQGNDQNTSGIVQPIPASEVFDHDALPLYLPELDNFLNDKTYFSMPNFSIESDQFTEEEKDLYGFRSPASSFDSDYEVCGSQIALPNEALNREDLRKRKMSKAQIHVPKRIDEDEREIETGLLGEADVDASEKDDEKYSSTSSTTLPVLNSELSTKSKPKTRLKMFPPLMLLKENSLDELKSNAVGPRKPPGGFIGSLPGVGTLLGTIIDFVVGVEGSTLSAGIFRLQLFIDFVQLLNLNTQFTSVLTFVDTGDRKSTSVNRVLLHTIPSFMALNFVSVFGAAIILLYVFTGIVACLLLAFWRMTKRYNPNRTLQNYSSQPWYFKLIQREDGKGGVGAALKSDEKVKAWHSSVWTKFANISIVMLLTTFYIPLSKLSVDALVWSSNYWPTHDANPNASTITNGMCYRTNTDPDEFNWAYVIIPVAALTVIFYTLWFPYQMRKTVKKLLPHVDEYNELGNKRTNDEMETEYMRLLSRDQTPLNFMYNDYRRRWGTYKPLYILCFKLSNLLVIGIFNQQNCLFHNFEVRKMLVIQQSCLITMQAILFCSHLYIQPFIGMLSNRSELCSRFGYVCSAIIGLLVALQVKGETVYNSVLLYIVYALTYSGNIYFSLAGTSWMSHWIKRSQKRIDFSIDVFSPMLQLEKHIKRRVWQETLSIILLSGPEYRMPIGQMVVFSIDDHWPPYLLQFCGTAAERHVENLKIVKSVGIDHYKESLDALMVKGNAERWKWVMKRIQTEFAGPDAFWQPIDTHSQMTNKKAFQGVSSFFGKAFLVPFPPTLVITYDQTVQGLEGATVELKTLEELEAFVWQNESETIQKRRWVRVTLRSLDGQKVYCPHVEAVKSTPQGLFQAWLAGLENRKDRQYTLAKPVYYEEGVLTIKRKMGPTLGNYNFESGFDVFITYSEGQRRDAAGLSLIRTPLTIDATAAFGLRDDFEFTSSVQQFFNDNVSNINILYPQMGQILRNYRIKYFREALEKRKTMHYAFLTEIFDKPLFTLKEMETEFERSKNSLSVRQLPQRYPAASKMLLQRMSQISQTCVHQWWYIFWDDLWRQNNGDYAALRSYRQIFNPQYSSSIAYTPMSRDMLETMLKSMKGIWRIEGTIDKAKQWNGIIDQGLVNRIYFMLDELAFNKSLRRQGEGQPGIGKGEPLLVGTKDINGSVDVRSLDTISLPTDSKADAALRLPLYTDPFAATSRHTGGGTDDNNSSIVERYAWPWTEQRLSGRPSTSILKRIKGRILEWLSIRPYKLHDDIQQLYIYLRIVDGHYEAPQKRTLKRN